MINYNSTVPVITLSKENTKERRLIQKINALSPRNFMMTIRKVLPVWKVNWISLQCYSPISNLSVNISRSSSDSISFRQSNHLILYKRKWIALFWVMAYYFTTSGENFKGKCANLADADNVAPTNYILNNMFSDCSFFQMIKQ